MLNPGFRSKTRKEKFEVDAGDLISCPICKRPLMYAIIEKLYIRCKHCGWWIFLEKNNIKKT